MIHDQRRAARRRLQRVAAQLTAGSVVVKHEDGILKNKIKYTGLEENRSGDAAVATQGFGRVSDQQPEKFAPHQREEIVRFFRREGFAVIVGALSDEEVQHLNDFYVRTQIENPRAWGLGDAREGFHLAQGMIYSQPLLDHPELDKYTQHPSNYGPVCDILGGPDKPRFAEFNFREAPEGGESKDIAPQPIFAHLTRTVAA